MKIQVKFSEIAILFIVVVMSIAANLSDHYNLGNVVSRKVLLIVLTATIVIALFHYLRLMLFLTIAALAVGANLPDDLASSLGISPAIMLIFLGLLISVSLVSYLFKLLPTGIEQPRINSAESRKSVLAAIRKGDLVNLHRLMEMNVEINFTEDGTMPVFIAAENGYTDVMQILVHHGAKFRVKNQEGKTPMEVALDKGYTRIAEILHHAAESSPATAV